MADIEGAKKVRQRSPLWPFISLIKAMERALEFYAAQRDHAAPQAAAMGIWGYGPKSSGGLQTISALKQFGLMTDKGSGKYRHVGLTDLALQIIRDQRAGSPDRAAALRKAALSPKIFREMWEKWGVRLPAEATVTYHLVHERGFTEKAAADLFRLYQDTIAYAKLTESDKVGEESEGAAENGDGEDEAPRTPRGRKVPLMEGERVVFTEEGQPQQYVKIVASGEVDASLLDALANYVERHRNRLRFVVPRGGPPEPEEEEQEG